VASVSGRVDEWTPEQLRTAADVGIPPARPATINVERLERTGSGGEGVLVELTITHDEGRERWRLTFDSMWTDVCTFPLADAALMVRANIVEWWDTRLAEPEPPWLTTERIG